MQKNHFKTAIGLFLTSLLLTVFAPVDSFAQRANRKAKKVKVVSPAKRYNQLPRRGTRVRVLPQRSNVISYRRTNYHYRDGIFYRPANGSFIVTAPPIGIRVATLPPNPFRVTRLGSNYYYYYGTYYMPVRGGGYEVVAAPVGAIVDVLPQGYEVFELDSMVYYRFDETYYKAILEPNGSVAYQVVRV